ALPPQTASRDLPEVGKYSEGHQERLKGTAQIAAKISFKTPCDVGTPRSKCLFSRGLGPIRADHENVRHFRRIQTTKRTDFSRRYVHRKSTKQPFLRILAHGSGLESGSERNPTCSTARRGANPRERISTATCAVPYIQGARGWGFR